MIRPPKNTTLPKLDLSKFPLSPREDVVDFRYFGIDDITQLREAAKSGMLYARYAARFPVAFPIIRYLRVCKLVGMTDEEARAFVPIRPKKVRIRD